MSDNNKQLAKLPLVLTLVAVIAATLLGFSNLYTAPVIRANHLETMENRMFEYFPEANAFEIEEVDGEEFYLALEDEDVLGAAAVVKPAGYGGVIEMMVAVDIAGNVQGVEILSHAETPGLGDRITDEEWQEQFIDKSIFDPITVGEDIDALSNATRSSQGVADGVRMGIDKIAADYLGRDPEDIPEITDAPDTLEDGTFVGEGMGRNPGIRVEVTVSGGQIENLELLEHDESEAYMEAAWEQLSQTIVEENNHNVDTVSRATESSLGIMAAVQEALVGVEREIAYEDGTYTGVGEGREPGIEVEIEISGGEIVSMDLIDHNDSQGYFEDAWEGMLERVLAQQTHEVDTVSGATASSIGIREAVRDALSKAVVLPIDLEDGIYQGTGVGRNPGIVVNVTIVDGGIEDLELVDYNDSPQYLYPAWENISESIIAQQTLDVDAVSGATQSSDGIMEAINNALDEDQFVREVDVEEPKELADGTYVGEGIGRNPGIEVEVTVSNGEITSIELLEHDDTEEYMQDAWAEIPDRIIAAQDTDVDTVSGATGSSEGIMEAVENALEQAFEAEAPDMDAAEEVDEDESVDEEYVGTAEGYNDEIELAVIVEDGEIVDLQINEHSETEERFESAWDALSEQIIETGETDLDAVSEATYNSEAIMEAAQEALEEAGL